MSKPPIKRREFLDLVAMSAAAFAAAPLGACAEPASADASCSLGEELLAVVSGPRVAMLLYPELTLLDLIAPYTCFSTVGITPQLVWKTRAPIRSDDGVLVTPSATFDECPTCLDVLFVPGGGGTAAMMRDREVLTFLQARAARAKLVTSVCTGSLILGAAGLLRGYKATSHWTVLELLPILDAVPVQARYVEDRNRITGGGVTSGIDFGLRILERLRGRAIAEGSQLAMEYAPEPPFDAGTPETASSALVAAVRTVNAPYYLDRKSAAEQARNGF